MHHPQHPFIKQNNKLQINRYKTLEKETFIGTHFISSGFIK